MTLIEDLHWLDAASEEFLEHMVDARAGSRNLLLLNFRPEYHADWMQKSWYRQIPLTPLGREAIAELLADLLGNDPSIAALAGPIHARTGGNPFFTEEVVQTLIESGHLEGTRGAYRLVTPIERLEVPATVQAVLAARIDRLPEREKRLLQVASVIGKDFPEPLLAAVAELPADELKAALAALQRAEFIHEQALYPVAEYAFKHPLTQEVALGSQLQERRRQVHAAVARAIEQQDAEHLDERAALLAHHWEEAGEALTAARWHRRAAEWVGRTDFAAATHHWGRVRALLRELPDDREAAALGIAACRQLLNMGWRVGTGLDEARALLEEGQTLANAIGDRRAHLYLSMVYGRARCGAGDVAAYLELAIENRRAALEIDDIAVQANASTVPRRRALLRADGSRRRSRSRRKGSRAFPATFLRRNGSSASIPIPRSRSGAAIASPGWVGCPRGSKSSAAAAASPRRTARRRWPAMPCSSLPKPTITPTTRTGHSRAPVRSRRSAADWASLRCWSPSTQLAFGYAHLAAGRAADAIEPARAALDALRARGEARRRACPRRSWPRPCCRPAICRPRRSAAEEAIALCRRSLRGNYEADAHGVMARALLRRDGAAARDAAEAALAERRRADRTHGSEDARARALRVARRAGRRARRRRDARRNCCDRRSKATTRSARRGTPRGSRPGARSASRSARASARAAPSLPATRSRSH